MLGWISIEGVYVLSEAKNTCFTETGTAPDIFGSLNFWRAGSVGG